MEEKANADDDKTGLEILLSEQFSADKLFQTSFVNYVLSRHGTAEVGERKSFSMPVRQNITSIQSMQMETITAYEKLCTTAWH